MCTYTYISNHNFISLTQSAFLKYHNYTYHSTIISLLLTTSNWYNAVDKGHVNLVCFLIFPYASTALITPWYLYNLPHIISITENSWFQLYLTV